MSNQLYALGREGFLTGAFNWLTDQFSIALVDNTYVPSLPTDEFLSALPSGCIIATKADIGGKAVTAGVASAENSVFVALTGPPIIYIVIYQDTGVAATSRLIGLIDTASGLPYIPDGSTVTIVWDPWYNGIFSL